MGVKIVNGAVTQQLVTLDSIMLKSLLLTAGSGADATATLISAESVVSAASAAAAVADVGNTGNGTVSGISVANFFTKTETWTLTCIVAAANSGTFSVVGSVTGARGNATVGVAYHSNSVTTANSEINFTINDGLVDFIVGDKFTIATTMATFTNVVVIAAPAKTSAFFPGITGGSAFALPNIIGQVLITTTGAGSFTRIEY